MIVSVIVWMVMVVEAVKKETMDKVEKGNLNKPRAWDIEGLDNNKAGRELSWVIYNYFFLIIWLYITNLC